MAQTPNLSALAPYEPFLALGASVIQKAITDLANKDLEIAVDAAMWLAGDGEDFTEFVLCWHPGDNPLLAHVVGREVKDG